MRSVTVHELFDEKGDRNSGHFTPFELIHFFLLLKGQSAPEPCAHEINEGLAPATVEITTIFEK
jgi:hypothetical protein